MYTGVQSFSLGIVPPSPPLVSESIIQNNQGHEAEDEAGQKPHIVFLIAASVVVCMQS